MYPTPDPATHEANRLAEGARHILQPGIGALIFIRGSTALEFVDNDQPGRILENASTTCPATESAGIHVVGERHVVKMMVPGRLRLRIKKHQQREVSW